MSGGVERRNRGGREGRRIRGIRCWKRGGVESRRRGGVERRIGRHRWSSLEIDIDGGRGSKRFSCGIHFSVQDHGIESILGKAISSGIVDFESVCSPISKAKRLL